MIDPEDTFAPDECASCSAYRCRCEEDAFYDTRQAEDDESRAVTLGVA